MKRIINIVLAVLPLGLIAQSYTDYIGGGHSVGVTVTASDSRPYAPAENTIDGDGLDSRYFDAARFLSHATAGPTPTMVEDLVTADNDYEGWIDDQFNIPTSNILPEMVDIWALEKEYLASEGFDTTEIFGPWQIHFNYAWYETIMTSDDHLRQKIAYALSQILVVSSNSDLRDWGEAMSGYYDILLNHSFGNYRDLLEEVTYSIQMGYYLSHLNNAKENQEANTSPDENYAREIMQLFSIGLYELNNDGTRVLDGNGDPIPTYDQDDIQEFAKVFTGLGIGELMYPDGWPYEPFFGLAIWAAVKNSTMIMYEDFHETTEKTLLNGVVLPANQSGDQDISDAIDNLFNHPNVGPFIGNLLIKRLVKSNPSPAYISRVADAFNDNGSGVRGDMKSVIKAILLDEEARSGEAMFDASTSRVREPVMKLTSLAKGLPFDAPEGRYWNVAIGYTNNTGQGVLSSPTVFNFYLPNFQPVGEIKDAGMTSPEMKLHNTTSAINYINEIFVWNLWEGNVFYDWIGNNDDGVNDNFNGDIKIDHDALLYLAEDPELLINELDKRLTYGQLTDATRSIIVPAIRDLWWGWDDNWKKERIKTAIYYMLISPDFNIMK